MKCVLTRALAAQLSKISVLIRVAERVAQVLVLVVLGGSKVKRVLVGHALTLECELARASMRVDTR